MSKLEESLDLLERIENYKNYKDTLNKTIDELLEEYGFRCVKEEKKGISLYTKDEEVFAKLGDEEYCWAKPNVLKKELDYGRVYKDFKKTLQPNILQLLGIFGSASSAVILGSMGLIKLINSDYSLLAVAGWDLSLILPFYFILDNLIEYNKKKFEKNCEEVYYGKEALEKAFRR